MLAGGGANQVPRAAQLPDLRVQLARVDLVDAQSVKQFKVGDGMLPTHMVRQDAQDGPVEAARQVEATGSDIGALHDEHVFCVKVKKRG